jgi:hypothetical protein
MNIIESVTNRVGIYEMKTKSEDEIAERFLNMCVLMVQTNVSEAIWNQQC